MSYLVVLTPRAKHDLRTIHAHIFKQAPDAADDWLDRAERAVNSLNHHPDRCPLAPESGSFDEPIRELLLGRGNRGIYRFLFVVRDKSVYILHIRHGSMLPWEPPGE
ncbi:MAG TPA: type II toxin-antitoxin system RelE/ParE family toxin [Terriglobales bacterium]|jgi:plasmid stabilization system protein ParE|nr:type II toxin-antitoxin system RelE/ParE family toxin [Terriglobales bacterium]